MCSKNGLYSCKYDSTRQRSLIFSNTKNYNKYTISMRLEMLLASTLVITDAQWYDGLYFSKMIQNGEFDDFISFVSKATNVEQLPLHIRRRKSVLNMVLNPFWFSSIENEELQSYLYSLYSTNIFDRCKNKGVIDFDEYFGLLETEINKNKSNLKDAFENFKYRFSLLHNRTPEKLFLEWGEHQYIPEDMLRAKVELGRLLDKNSKEVNYSKINNIKILLGKDFPPRSEVKNSVNELTNMPKIDGTSFAEYFMAVFDSYYNFAIAKQHNCRFYGLYDNFAISKNRDMPSYTYCEINKTTLPSLLFDGLELLNWNEFGTIYYNPDIIRKRNKWLKAFEHEDGDSIKKILAEYINLIMQKIYEIKPQIVNNSVFYKISDSKRFVNIEIDDDGNVVSGLNPVECKDSKNFCFFSNNVNENLKNNQIVRYATIDSGIEIFDTIIAPIKHIIVEREKDASH